MVGLRQFARAVREVDMYVVETKRPVITEIIDDEVEEAKIVNSKVKLLEWHILSVRQAIPKNDNHL